MSGTSHTPDEDEQTEVDEETELGAQSEDEFAEENDELLQNLLRSVVWVPPIFRHSPLCLEDILSFKPSGKLSSVRADNAHALTPVGEDQSSSVESPQASSAEHSPAMSSSVSRTPRKRSGKAPATDASIVSPLLNPPRQLSKEEDVYPPDWEPQLWTYGMGLPLENYARGTKFGSNSNTKPTNFLNLPLYDVQIRVTADNLPPRRLPSFR